MNYRKIRKYYYNYLFIHKKQNEWMNDTQTEWLRIICSKISFSHFVLFFLMKYAKISPNVQYTTKLSTAEKKIYDNFMNKMISCFSLHFHGAFLRGDLLPRIDRLVSSYFHKVIDLSNSWFICLLHPIKSSKKCFFLGHFNGTCVYVNRLFYLRACFIPYRGVCVGKFVQSASNDVIWVLWFTFKRKWILFCRFFSLLF